VVAITSCVALAGLPLLVHLRSEFDPLKLRNPNTESSSSFLERHRRIAQRLRLRYLELSKDPMMTANTAQVLVGSSTEAAA
jgi:hypothetical protein